MRKLYIVDRYHTHMVNKYTERLTVAVDRPFLERLNRACEEYSSQRSSFVRSALVKHMNDLEKEGK